MTGFGADCGYQTWIRGVIGARHVHDALQIRHPYGAKMPGPRQSYLYSDF
jgi:hypothetical protein